MTLTQSLPSLVGQPVLRREDPPLLRGEATFVDDLKLPGMLHMAIVRSTFAHARLKSVETSAAREAPGVSLVLTGADVKVGGSLAFEQSGEFTRGMDRMGRAMRYPLANDKVRFVGEGIAAVVASDRYQVRDAVDLIEIDYEELPAVVDPVKAMAADSPLVHEQFGTNVAITLHRGDQEATDAAFKRADVTVKQWMVNPRIIPTPMEPRGVVAHYDAALDHITVWMSCPKPHFIRRMLATVLPIPEERIHVIAPAIGGGFGAKNRFYPEEVLACHASMRLGKPVKWIEERSESFLSTNHGRGIHAEIELAALADGTVIGQRVRMVGDIGAYQVGVGVPVIASLVLAGVYRTPALSIEINAVFTNKPPTSSYRGAGQPEATLFVERAMDMLARKLKLDPVELRRRNLIKSNQFPYKSPAGVTYDTGNYQAALDKALSIVGYEEVRRQQQALREQDRYLGIGVSTFVEICAVGPVGGWEMGAVRVERTGKVTVLTGTSPHGQGGETTLAQVAAQGLGVPLEDVTVLYSDTRKVPSGQGTGASRGVAVGGSAVFMSVEKIKEKAKLIAGHILEARLSDLEYEAGRLFVTGYPDRGVSLQEIAEVAWRAVDLPTSAEPGLEATSYFLPSNYCFPFGTHIAVVELDRETGRTEILRYIAVDDCGNVINPLLVEGQVHGALAQGIAGALMEEVVYGDDGQLLTASLMDYHIPKAEDLPSFEVDRTETPTDVNPLGAKGVGEGATIGPPAAIANAVIDALAPFGIDHVDIMLRPEKIWQLMRTPAGDGH